MRKAKIPIYGQDEAKCPPGLYLALFHGRDKKVDQLDSWGFNGPLIGPLRYVHTTYGQHIKFDFIGDARVELYGFSRDAMCDILLDEDLAPFDGKLYGDWAVFNLPAK